MNWLDSIGRAGWERVRFLLFVALVGLCFLGGGASRGDVMSLLYLRPAAIIIAAALIATPGPTNFAQLRIPFALLGLLALWMVLQMVPLPSDVWSDFPGRAIFAKGAAVLGIEQPWRPISITPDLTLNSLAALVVPLAALIGFACLTQEQRRALLPVFIALACFSAVLAVAQLAAGSVSPTYLYTITNEGAAVGLFSNRNHQAIMLALTFPLLGLWAAKGSADPTKAMVRTLTALAIGLFLIPMLLVTGSRAGIILGALGAIAGCLEYLRSRSIKRRVARWGAYLGAAALVALIGGAFAIMTLSRGVAIQRLLQEDLRSDPRVENFPTTARILEDMFGVGSGFGSFDPVFRVYEPFETLSDAYFNHAHNDLLELAITGGIPAVLILLAFLIWWGRATWNAFGTNGERPGQSFARTAAVITGLLMMASLVDYPLRTPVHALIFAVACGWLAANASNGRRQVTEARLRSAENGPIPTARRAKSL